MSTKAFRTLLSVVVFSIFVFVSGAEASVEAVHAVDNLFGAVNTGELSLASNLFAADAVVHDVRARQSYEGAAEIGRFLDGLHHEGRAYEIVQLAMAGDRVDLIIDIADAGHVWGQQTLTADVQNGMIQRLELRETRLTLWRISR